MVQLSLAPRRAMAAAVKTVALAALLIGNAGCSGDDDSPTSPTPQAQTVVFTQAATGFMTSDVRDSEGDVVRFDTAGNLIWVPTGARFSGFPATGNLLGPTQGFEVRFGTENGTRAAYFTERGPSTICDIDVVNGMLNVSPTTRTVPAS
jgi:hypothetical protein